MIEINNLTPPSPKQFKTVIAGIRNAYKSHNLADSEIVEIDDHEVFALGEEDSKLANTLVARDNPSHRKFLRQLPVVMDIKAPLYFWKQLDTYKIGTTANSESSMHCLIKEPFKPDDFSVENFLDIDVRETNSLECLEYEDFDLWFSGIGYDYVITTEEYFKDNIVNLLNSLRYFYLETKNKEYWYAINELLPQSYFQKRTWAANYEVLLNIITQRIHHKLPEWRDLIVYWLKNVPYLYEFVYAAGIITIKDKNVVINDSSKEILYSWIES